MNVYFGNGLKFDETPLAPPVPLPVEPECDLLSEEYTMQPDITSDPNPPEPVEEEAAPAEGEEGAAEGAGEAEEN